MPDDNPPAYPTRPPSEDPPAKALDLDAAATLRTIQRTIEQVASDLRGHRILSDERYEKGEQRHRETLSRIAHIEQTSKRAEVVANAAQRATTENAHEVKGMIESIVTHNVKMGERFSKQDRELETQTTTLKRIEAAEGKRDAVLERLDKAETSRAARESALVEHNERIWRRLQVMIAVATVLAGGVAWAVSHALKLAGK